MSNPKSELLDIGHGAQDAPVSPAMGVAMIAFNFALKFHEIQAVKDGTLYQQYKLEGRNMVPIELWMVIQTAKEISVHLLEQQNEISQLMTTAVFDALEALAAEDDPDQSACEASDAAQVVGESLREE